MSIVQDNIVDAILISSEEIFKTFTDYIVEEMRVTGPLKDVALTEFAMRNALQGPFGAIGIALDWTERGPRIVEAAAQGSSVLVYRQMFIEFYDLVAKAAFAQAAGLIAGGATAILSGNPVLALVARIGGTIVADGFYDAQLSEAVRRSAVTLFETTHLIALRESFPELAEVTMVDYVGSFTSGSDVVDASEAFMTSLDTVRTFAGADVVTTTIFGENYHLGSGDDLIHVIGKGRRIDGGANLDTVSYQFMNAAITANLDVSVSLLPIFDDLGTVVRGADYDTLLNVENVIGSGYHDRIQGADSVLTLGGNNLLVGLGGNDLLFGSGGEDVLVGDGGTASGNDTLAGGNGNDTLQGGGGNDRLTGGAGEDFFVFDASSGEDTIQDFQRGFDIILIEASAAVSGGPSVSLSGTTQTVRYGDTTITVETDHITPLELFVTGENSFILA